jgi:Skp family chaperone for outer membrane proteins
MKALVKSVLLAALLAGLLFTPETAQAQGKIGVVNLRTLFDGYYKRKLADLKIKEREKELLKELEELVAKRRAAEETYNQTLASANDLAASKEERDRRKADAEQKLASIKKMEGDIELYRKQARDSLLDQQTRLRTRVLEEIDAEIEAKAKADGYFLIINKDALDRNETKIYPYHNGEHDITQHVLSKLNAGAPLNLDLGPGTPEPQKQP